MRVNYMVGSESLMEECIQTGNSTKVRHAEFILEQRTTILHTQGGGRENSFDKDTWVGLLLLLFFCSVKLTTLFILFHLIFVFLLFHWNHIDGKPSRWLKKTIDCFIDERETTATFNAKDISYDIKYTFISVFQKKTPEQGNEHMNLLRRHALLSNF